MVNIECTRCGATGIDYPTYYVAKFTLTHERGCGARIGIPSYTATAKATPTETPLPEPKEEKPKVSAKPKRKKTAKKIDHSAT